MSDKICRRNTDGQLFRPSFRDGYNDSQAIVDTLTGRASFYFRAVEWRPYRWWPWCGRWVDTGEIWEPQAGEFDIFDEREARQLEGGDA